MKKIIYLDYNFIWKIIIIVFLMFFSINSAAFDYQLQIDFSEAIRNKESLDIIEDYLKEGADPNYNYAGMYLPALSEAAFADGDVALVELLLKYGAEPTVDDLGAFMVYGCRLDIIQLLLENGVDLDKEIQDFNIFGTGVIDEDFIEEESRTKNLQPELARTLLNVEKKLPLLIAVEADRLGLAELLLEYGADPEPVVQYSSSKREIIEGLQNETEIRRIFNESEELLEAGFHKKYLDEVKKAMAFDPISEYFNNEFYMNMLKEGFSHEDIGLMLLENYNLLMEEEKTGVVKEEIIMRLLKYGLFAERAGQRALLKQTSQKLGSLIGVSGFGDYRTEIESAAELLEGIYLLIGDNPEQGYNYLLENEVLESLQYSRLDIVEDIKTQHDIWQSLYIDLTKLAYLLGIDKSELQQDVKYSRPVPMPYPDLEGNIIEGIDTGDGSASSNPGSDLDSGNGDNEDSDTGTGSMGTVLD